MPFGRAAAFTVPERNNATIETVKPQVLAVVEQFWHREPGGTATATENTLSALVDLNGFDVVGLAARHSPPVESPSNEPVGHRPEPWSRMPAGSTLRFHPLPRPLLYESWLRFGLPSVDGYCADDSVVWASSLIVPPTKAPVVATVHDLDFLTNPHHPSKRGRRFFPLMWRRAVERADVLVCPTEIVAEDCVRRGVPPDRLQVIPWGVKPPLCGPSEAEYIQRMLGLPDEFVLWVGPLSPRKNPKGAALAMGRIDADIVVVGPKSEDPEASAAFLSLGARVHRLPFVSDETLSALYRQASVLLYPSFAEGFGLPVLEAMAHGTPVVTSLGTATAEVAGGAALLIDPNNPDDIAEAIRAAMHEAGTRRRLIDDGLSRAGQLSWQATAKAYADVFGSLLRSVR